MLRARRDLNRPVLDSHPLSVVLSLLLLAISFAPALAQTWEIEVLDNGKQFSEMTDRSLRLDAQGHPHIAYGGDWLYYAWHDGVEWQSEVADASFGIGRFASLDLDGSGSPHIGYYDSTTTDLKYAYKDAAGWHIETVDSEGNVGKYTSIALDASGSPHIGYYDATNTDLKYAHKDAAGWHIETVDSQGYVGRYTSIALDGQGSPHIGYNTYVGGDLKYAYKDAAGWHVQTVDSEGSVGSYTSLALDSAGLVHICYYDYTNKDLKYARMASRLLAAAPAALAAGPALPDHLTAIAVWPNPAREVVHARLAGQGGEGILRLTVVDLLGRRITSLQHPETIGAEAMITLRLPESIPTGQYFLGVEGEGARQFVPITVVR
ncbi:hypothetical protein JXA88_17925 [Candidatus Fermentibacteria bacterium]|nr:hypothetical protein [Candidatus Fermentibacteria bacterium]